MKFKISSILINIVVCIIGACLLTSCYTVKGAFQGAGKDVSVLVGPQGSHHHKVVTKKTTVNNGSKTTTTTTTTAPATSPTQSTSGQSSSAY